VLRDAGRSGTAGTTAGRLRRLLATTQVALAFMLLISARRCFSPASAPILAIDPGSSRTGVVTAAINLPSSAVSRRRRRSDRSPTDCSSARAPFPASAPPG